MMGLKGFRARRRNKQAGFSLVEVIIAVAIFSAVSVPLMSAFVLSSRLNYKTQLRANATTIAQSAMEGIKAFGLEEVSKEAHTVTAGGVQILANDGTAYGGGETGTSSYVDGAFVQHGLITKTLQQTNAITLYSGIQAYGDYSVVGEDYVFYFKHVNLSKTYYDIKVTIKPDQTPENNIALFDKVYDGSTEIAMKSKYKTLNLGVYVYYDVTIDVVLNGDSFDEPIATYEGSMREKYFVK
jgi:prepilin-type N-terminal cleavage/methylation domain-containing protein